MSTEQWGRQLISLNWVHILSMWEQCSLEEYGGSTEQQLTHTIHNLLLEAQFVQATEFPISYVNRDLLFRPLEVLQTYSLSNLSASIRNTRHLVNTYKLKAQHDIQKPTRYKVGEG